MFKTTAILSLLLVGSLFSEENLSLNSIIFEGNEKIKTTTLKRVTEKFLTQPLNETTAHEIVKSVEEFYRKHNYALAYATPLETNTTNQSITIKIKKHANFTARSLYEMEQRALQENKISRIFFEGNKKLSTPLLMRHIEPYLGKENTQEYRTQLLQSIDDLYKQHGYTLAYAQIKSNENGILRVSILKHFNSEKTQQK